MTPDPDLAFSIALIMAVAWTMLFAGTKKRLLEPKQRRRTCPSCGRAIEGRVCNAH